MKVEILVLRMQILTISSVILFRSYKMNANFRKLREREEHSEFEASWGCIWGFKSVRLHSRTPPQKNTKSEIFRTVTSTCIDYFFLFVL